MAKKVTIKVYSPSGEFLKVWEKATFKEFVKQINGGLGPCKIELGEKVNYSGGDLKFNNEIRILISDKDTKGADENPKLIYSGYISSYFPWVDGKEEGITVNLLGYYTKLAQDIWKNGDTTTFNYDSVTDFGQMFRDLIDRYIAETTSPKLSYADANIGLTSTTGKYRFEMTTYRKAIDVIKRMSPIGWFWYVGEKGIVEFKVKPTSPTHEFLLGKHFKSVRIERSMEKIKNALLLWNRKYGGDQVYKLYTNEASIKDYGRRMEKLVDERIGDVGGDADTADEIGNKFVAEHKNPDVKVVVEILDNNESDKGYDIESINPGETCIFRGFDESLADIFEYNMLITKVEYELGLARITIEPTVVGIVNRQEETMTKIKDLLSTEAPVSLGATSEYGSKARRYRTTTVQSVGSGGAPTKVELNGENYDAKGEFDNYKFTAKNGGFYLVTGVVRFDSGVNAKYMLTIIEKNGSIVATAQAHWSSTSPQSATVVDVIYLATGDYVELFTYQNTGVAKDVSFGSDRTFMAVHRIS